MMNSSLASGDNNISPSNSPRYFETVKSADDEDSSISKDNDECGQDIENITPQIIDDNEVKLKARIAQCKNIIDSLKLQLTEEKAKLKIERKNEQLVEASQHVPEYDGGVPSLGPSMYSACVESKLYCDESLIKYEQQLQKYQNTLNMAQNEKKNAIRKQMLAKAFKLKLMEVENQCNIELLRVKQSLQCLQPLQIIANKWKTNSDDNVFGVTCYDLMPNFLELKARSGSDVNTYKEESCQLAKDDAGLSD